MGSFPALSCEFATLDVSDALGTKRMNLTKTLRKTPIDLNLDHHGAAYEDNHKVQPKYDDEDMWVSHEGSQGGGVDGGWGGRGGGGNGDGTSVSAAEHMFWQQGGGRGGSTKGVCSMSQSEAYLQL